MIFSTIAIQNFRNLLNVELIPNDKINFFTGDNAQGKSNLLEAIGLISNGRSFRRARENELIHWDKTFTRIKSFVYQKEDPIEIVLTLSKERMNTVKKRIYVNGVNLIRLSQFVGKVKTASFSRYDLDVITGPPLNRRRFIDMIISSISPRYLHALQQFHLTLKERNNWLSSSNHHMHSQVGEVWEEQLAQYGSILLSERIEIVGKLRAFAQNIFHELSAEEEKLHISYQSSFQIDSSERNSIYFDFLKSLRENKDQEEKLKTTLVGPHRDDLWITIGDISLRAYGSQGQQRLAAIALKLAEAELIETLTSQIPILLLDDCFSELDPMKNNRLWKYVERKGQVFITSNTIPAGISPSERMIHYRIQEGKVFSVLK